VIPGDEHDGDLGKRLPHPLKLAEGEHDGGIGWTDRMEQITRDHDGVGGSGDHSVDSSTEGLGDIGLPLIDAACRLPVVLANAEVRIGDVGEFHGWRMNNETGKSKQLGAIRTQIRQQLAMPASAVRIIGVLQGGNPPPSRGDFAGHPASKARGEIGAGILRSFSASG
jgi:hypothetical protein